MKHLYKTALLMALLTQPAVAQVKQTAEGAHQFLQITTAAGGVQGYIDVGSGQNSVNYYYYLCYTYSGNCTSNIYGTWNAPAYKAVSYKYTDTCKGALTANAPYHKTDWDDTHYDGRRRTNHADPLGSLNRTLDWKKIALVQRNEQNITLKEGGVTYLFVFPGVDIATRVAFAMEFLRVECDPSASTGF